MSKVMESNGRERKTSGQVIYVKNSIKWQWREQHEPYKPRLGGGDKRAQQAFDQARLTGRLNPSLIGEYEREKAARERQRILEWCGIHARFAETTFAAIERQGIAPSMGENFIQAKEYAEKFDRHIRTGTGLILKGQVGTLKTTLAVAVLQENDTIVVAQLSLLRI